MLIENGLPPVSRALSSPFVRCVDTCSRAAIASGYPGKLCIEPAIAETVCDEWYYSWAIPGADANWAGPSHCRVGNRKVPLDKMHPAALRPVGTLFLNPEDLNAPEHCGPSGVDLNYVPVVAASDLTRSAYKQESKAEASQKLAVLECCEALYPGETVLLCSHGGPCSEMYEHLITSTDQEKSLNERSGSKSPTRARVGKVGYTALFLVVKVAGSWLALMKASTSHRRINAGSFFSSLIPKALRPVSPKSVLEKSLSATSSSSTFSMVSTTPSSSCSSIAPTVGSSIAPTVGTYVC